MSPGITGVLMLLSSTCTMASRRVELKNTIESTTRYIVEQVSMSLPIYEDTKSFVDKVIKMR